MPCPCFHVRIHRTLTTVTLCLCTDAIHPTQCPPPQMLAYNPACPGVVFLRGGTGACPFSMERSSTRCHFLSACTLSNSLTAKVAGGPIGSAVASNFDLPAHSASFPHPRLALAVAPTRLALLLETCCFPALRPLSASVVRRLHAAGHPSLSRSPLLAWHTGFSGAGLGGALLAASAIAGIPTWLHRPACLLSPPCLLSGPISPPGRVGHPGSCTRFARQSGVHM